MEINYQVFDGIEKLRKTLWYQSHYFRNFMDIYEDLPRSIHKFFFLSLKIINISLEVKDNGNIVY